MSEENNTPDIEVTAETLAAAEAAAGRINYVDIEAEMQNSYLAYAMSVIVGRALPEVRDGLKPVHSRVRCGKPVQWRCALKWWRRWGSLGP